MAQFEVGNVIQITMFGKLHGQTIMNVFNYRMATSTEDPPAGPVAAEIAAQFFANLHLVVMARLSNEYTTDRLRIQDVYPTRYVHHDFAPSQPSNQGGQQVTNSLPSAMSIVTTLISETAGRSHRGRKFWAGIPVGADDDSVVAANVLQTWRGAVDPQLIADVEATVDLINYTLVPIIWSLTNPLEKDDVVAALTRETLRTQRRRVVGRGI